MKKKLGFIMSGVVAIGILGFGVLYSSTSQAEASLSTEDITKMVQEQYPGEITELEQETEFNRVIYEVEIKSEDKEYDIKLDGKTGEILNITEKPIKDRAKVIKEIKSNTAQVKKDQAEDEVKVEESKSEQPKVEENTQPKEVVISEKKEQQPTKEKTKEQAPKEKTIVQAPKEKAKEQAPKQKKSESKKTVISYDQAKKIALGAFPGEIDDIELDREDGRLIYEVEIENGDKEAEIEIDAYTGEIIVIEIDED